MNDNNAKTCEMFPLTTLVDRINKYYKACANKGLTENETTARFTTMLEAAVYELEEEINEQERTA
jgi:hypothetical protein